MRNLATPEIRSYTEMKQRTQGNKTTRIPHCLAVIKKENQRMLHSSSFATTTKTAILPPHDITSLIYITVDCYKTIPIISKYQKLLFVQTILTEENMYA